mgnify:CR=1 FL=1
MLGLGFLGSFGHCLGMCGPLAVTLAVSRARGDQPQSFQAWRFHLWLNLGRIASYALVGAVIGALGSVVVASGQMAGIGSDLRRGIAIASGLLLIWVGVANLNPQLLPPIPLLNPMAQGHWHDRLSRWMMDLSGQVEPDQRAGQEEVTGRSSLSTPSPPPSLFPPPSPLNQSAPSPPSAVQMATDMSPTRAATAVPWRAIAVPLGLGLLWGLIPCGFLYAAQIKAAETTNIWQGSVTMIAFGLGTLPSMLGISLASSWLSRDRRSQLFRLGGWITLLTGVLILFRSGDTMTDYAGFGALILLIMTLVARPVSRVWAAPLRYRRALGVGAFVLATVHMIQTVAHDWNWQWQALAFMLPQHQYGVYFGMGALGLMTPLVLTSFNQAQKRLGASWRKLHLLAIPALGCAVAHCTLVGTRFLGRSQLTWVNLMMLIGLAIAVLGVFSLRTSWCWQWLRQGDRYVPPKS